MSASSTAQREGLEQILFKSAHMAGDLKIEGTTINRNLLDQAANPEEEAEGVVALDVSSARIDGSFILQRSILRFIKQKKFSPIQAPRSG